ncbi:hypothetical protein [Lignipirellula cremea]|uniref:DUF4013 domain-containing protein n=1 Tax=Lignipirellula cremea TaxID=2528010 RepID=A0A518DX87_9BACT|nr:hypothetical protein [Lignipirellula cremea]QDU96449.1 hypothetical protein Pla8534_42700 [Lignipirellula cremea]
MRLDRTQIAIRERSSGELFDLSLQLMAAYLRPLAITMALGAVPLTVLNYFLIGWMANVDPLYDFPLRYVWSMGLLLFIEAPLASVFATAWLGAAVFDQEPRVRQIVGEVWRLLPRILFVQVVMRGPLLAWLFLGGMALSRDRDMMRPVVEVLLLGAVAFVAGLMRAARPYMNEIVLLERNPLRSSDSRQPSIGRRSSLLHEPAGSDLLGRWLASALIAVLLFGSVYGGILFLVGVFSNSWDQSPLLVQWLFSLSFWTVATYFTVVRFLSYLDLRIRQEGWEVDIAIRAQAAELQQTL